MAVEDSEGRMLNRMEDNELDHSNGTRKLGRCSVRAGRERKGHVKTGKISSGSIQPTANEFTNGCFWARSIIVQSLLSVRVFALCESSSLSLNPFRIMRLLQEGSGVLTDDQCTFPPSRGWRMEHPSSVYVLFRFYRQWKMYQNFEHVNCMKRKKMSGLQRKVRWETYHMLPQRDNLSEVWARNEVVIDSVIAVTISWGRWV